MPKTLTLLSPAKLNLFLHITGRRPNGYHNLQSYFQLLDYGDTITFERIPDAKIELQCTNPSLESPDNLAFRAAKLLRDRHTPQWGIRIYLEKKLPMGAGVGGGSSNAATTLVALNQLWGLGMSQQELLDIGVSLGADVPFFISGKSAWVEGIGEKITPIERPSHWYLVIKPNCHVSTQEIFSNSRLTRNTKAIKIRAFLENEAHNQSLRNDCQAVACELYPQIREVLHWLNQFGQARMTGTGACVFLTFDKQEEVSKIAAKIPDEYEFFTAKGIHQIESK